MCIIDARPLSRSCKVSIPTPGVGGTLRHCLHRHDQRIDAVTDVSGRVAAGERVGSLVQNEAGKTTTLKMRSGLLPTGGGVEVCGFTPCQKHAAF